MTPDRDDKRKSTSKDPVYEVNHELVDKALEILTDTPSAALRDAITDSWEFTRAIIVGVKQIPEENFSKEASRIGAPSKLDEVYKFLNYARDDVQKLDEDLKYLGQQLSIAKEFPKHLLVQEISEGVSISAWICLPDLKSVQINILHALGELAPITDYKEFEEAAYIASIDSEKVPQKALQMGELVSRLEENIQKLVDSLQEKIDIIREIAEGKYLKTP